MTTSSYSIAPTEAINQEKICFDAKMYNHLNMTNVTAIFQPGSWEDEYANIQQFCSNKCNGTYCYHSQADNSTSCMDMALIRCPEGIISSCRSGYICVEKQLNGISCGPDGYRRGGVRSLNKLMQREDYYAQCLATHDALALPQPQNLTTTVDSLGSTITVGTQVFAKPFAIMTTVNCTMTYLSSLPSYLPSLAGPTSVCYNSDLPYDQLVPSATCNGPYPPGPMTTVCPSSAESSRITSQTLSSKAFTSEVSSSSSEYMMTTSSTMEPSCPITSETQTVAPTSSAISICPTQRDDTGMNDSDEANYAADDDDDYDDLDEFQNVHY